MRTLKIILSVVFFANFLLYCVENKALTSNYYSDPKKDSLDKIFGYSLVFVEGGNFKMGSDDYDTEQPIHVVNVGSFSIGKYEVTQAQWKFVMGENPSYFKDCNSCPVESVSWDDVQIFLKKLKKLTGKNYRLPTEAEWEFAAHGGTKSKGYIYAGSDDLNEVAQYEENNNKSTQPVGTKKPNELGIYDMSGNVWEWCQDRYKSYAVSAATTNRVYRGGGWGGNTVCCRITDRRSFSPDYRGIGLGLRLVYVP